MYKLLLAGACSLALFSTTPHPSQLHESQSRVGLLQCFPDRNLENVFLRAREMAAAIPVTHSADKVTYVEYLNGAKGPYPRDPETDYVWRKIPLTLLNPGTGELRTTVITRTIENGIVPTMMVSDDNAFLIAVEPRSSGTVWNWWNTSLTVLAPQGWVVAASHWKRYPSGVSLTYTPFSVSLVSALPELVSMGRAHAENDIATAFKTLERVPSRVVRGASVAQVLQEHLPNLAHAVISVEHADEYDVRVYKHDGGTFDPLSRAFVIFGGNGDAAFNATRSAAGALGLMQVMPRTWAEARELYPSAHLPARDMLPEHSHSTEIVAGFLTADRHLGLLAVYARRRGISLETLLGREDLQTLVLASYNMGPGRVGAQLRNPQWRDRVTAETHGYLAKFDQFTR